MASVFTWGQSWQNKQIIFYTDSQSITNIWRSGTCINKDIMRLVTVLSLFTAKLNINVLGLAFFGKMKFSNSGGAYGKGGNTKISLISWGVCDTRI